ncbi:MAG TPA: cation:proton antiporter [Mycobacteriales bacterium]|nr:cation:proton antiporter [Mycobacteriales bacterium]
MTFHNLVIVAAVAAGIPLFIGMTRAPVPGPVLEIVAGIVLGPAALDVLHVDATVRAAAVLGLGFLLFLAGLEIDVRRVVAGPAARPVLLGLAGTIAAGLVAGEVLHAAGLAKSPLLVGIAFMATSLGLVVPVLKDAGAADRQIGQLTIAGASSGELTAVVLLSLFFSQRGGALGGRLLLLGLLVVLVAAAVTAVVQARRWQRLSGMIAMLADTTAQIRVRLAVLALVGLAALAEHLGFEAILGAFLAGVLLRVVDPDAARRHPNFHVKLEGIGYGFLIPVFFVSSGVTFDLDALLDHPATLLRVPLYLALLLVIRGVPAIAYRGLLPAREVVAAGLLQSASLPFIVAATQIGLALGAVTPTNAAALVAAGLFSVLVYPVVALRIIGAPPRLPPTVMASAAMLDPM